MFFPTASHIPSHLFDHIWPSFFSENILTKMVEPLMYKNEKSFTLIFKIDQQILDQNKALKISHAFIVSSYSS